MTIYVGYGRFLRAEIVRLIAERDAIAVATTRQIMKLGDEVDRLRAALERIGSLRGDDIMRAIDIAGDALVSRGTEVSDGCY